MDLGEKLRMVRQEAGLSQRQLCGDVITRNMLSQIEHGTAKPSMETLKYLAGRLEKPVSWFLEEENVVSPNQTVMDRARAFFDREEFADALTALKDYRCPDLVYDREKNLLENLCLLSLAEKAAGEGRSLYVRELLDRLENPEQGYCARERRRRRILLESAMDTECMGRLSEQLPLPERELQLHARAALAREDADRAARLLEAVENRDENWMLLRGRVHMALKKYRPAISCLLEAERKFPEETAQLLEICYRETGNFRRAYHYACKQKK